jgi:hypothetical protein
MKILNIQARTKANMPPQWELYQWQMLPRGGDYELAEVTGAVAPLYTKGKRKGQHNWDKMDKTTRRTVYITIAENAAFIEQWQQETGKCANCEGSGKTLQSWHYINGATYRDCIECDGTGKFNRTKTK